MLILTFSNSQKDKRIDSGEAVTLSPITLPTSDQANFLTEEEIAQLQIDSRVNDFDPTQAIAYQTNSFSYTNRYGQIETHDPASFFHRLFLNKYDQEAQPNAGKPGGTTAQGWDS